LPEPRAQNSEPETQNREYSVAYFADWSYDPYPSIRLLTASWNMVGSPFGFSFGFAAALVFYFLPFVLFFYLRIVRFSTLASMTRPLVIRFNWYTGAWGPAAVANRRDLGTFESGRVAGRR